MKYFVSACLMGKKCKYNGGDNYDPDLVSLLKDDEIILICPETMGGLPIPRNPVELNDNRALDSDGNDYTFFFLKGVESVIEKSKIENPDAFILQPRSPSCGFGLIYDGTFSKTLVKSNGLLTQKLLEKGCKIYNPNTFKEENNHSITSLTIDRESK